jgi:hypothetical protein
MKKIPYLIVTPPYVCYSAGVRMLHALCHHLNESGYDAYVCSNCINLEWNEKSYFPLEENTHIIDNWIVVYPGTVPGNPYHGKTVVRYILGPPGIFCGDKVYDPSEILFTCNGETLRQYVPSDDHVLCIPLIEDFFKDEGLPREGGCFYVGKGWNIPRIPETEVPPLITGMETEFLIEILGKGMTEIRGMDREMVAHTLKTSTILYTYDNFSLIIEEAKKCGCPVVIVGEEISKVSYDEFTKDFEKQLANFIRITQSEALKRMEEKNGK